MFEQEALWSRWYFYLWLTPLHWPGTGSDPVHGSLLWSVCSWEAVWGQQLHREKLRECLISHLKKYINFSCKDFWSLHPHYKQQAMEVQSGRHSWSVYCQHTYQPGQCGRAANMFLCFVSTTVWLHFRQKHNWAKLNSGSNSLQLFFEGVWE